MQYRQRLRLGQTRPCIREGPRLRLASGFSRKKVLPMDATPAHVDFGPVTVYFGDRNGKYPDGNQVIVQGADMRVAFDTPQVSNHIGPALDDVDLVVLGHVHEDHLAGMHRLQRAAVQVHEADLAAARSWEGLARHYGYPEPVLRGLHEKVVRDFNWVPRPDATAYRDGARWDLGGGVRITAWHLPGHTSGHSALLVEPVGLLFIGDIELSSFGPYYGDATSDLRAFQRTLKEVARIPARIWVTSHHHGVITERAAFEEALTAFASRIEQRDAKLLGMLAAGPRTLDDLVAERLLYPPGYAELWIDAAERRTIAQHLELLQEAGRVRLLEERLWEAC